jgi:FKBP-type peptidyl-prolyl cis-trans isomerase SlpA
MDNPIQSDSRVTLHYELRLADGIVVDSTRAGEPMTFIMGSGDMVEILEQRLFGLTAGERHHFEISAAESQVPASAGVMQTLARSDFPAELEAGQVLGFALPSGEEVPGLIVSISDTEVTVDFSHPLAGRDLIFDVEILAVEPG